MPVLLLSVRHAGNVKCCSEQRLLTLPLLLLSQPLTHSLASLSPSLSLPLRLKLLLAVFSTDTQWGFSQRVWFHRYLAYSSVKALGQSPPMGCYVTSLFIITIYLSNPILCKAWWSQVNLFSKLCYQAIHQLLKSFLFTMALNNLPLLQHVFKLGLLPSCAFI